jgi:hypothetical protein
MRNGYTILAEDLKGKDMEYHGVEGRMALKLILSK